MNQRSQEENSIYNMVINSLGEGAYKSYFKNTPIKIYSNAIDFIFMGAFTRGHADMKYKSQVQEAIRRMPAHENKEVRFIHYNTRQRV
jgi:hypothetical protein